MDIIQLTGIRCYGYTGYLPEEQYLGQWFEVDLRMSLDLAIAGQSDAIEDTVPITRYFHSSLIATRPPHFHTNQTRFVVQFEHVVAIAEHVPAPARRHRRPLFDIFGYADRSNLVSLIGCGVCKQGFDHNRLSRGLCF